MASRPEPVKIAAAISAAIPVVVGFLVAVGVLDMTAGEAAATSDAGIQVVAAVLTLGTLVVSAIATFRARGKVTPIADPQDDSGNALVAR